jgi:hypothetical protein
MSPMSSRALLHLAAVVAATTAAVVVRAQQPPVGSATVVPIQVTGDPAKRFSMVVLGDGYTAAEMPRFRAHVDKHLNVLWSIEPFRSYRNYINVYAVEIVSGESGVTCDPEVRERRNTPLGLQFGGGCTNINARGITVADDKQDATRKYAAMATPHFDQILVIANTDTYGGIGGRLATTSGCNSLGPLITPHELGHSLGGLTDEYTYSTRGKPGGAFPGGEPGSIHMTTLSIEDMLTKQAKWYRWLGEPSESGGKIERFEGGSQRTTGVFRPSKHSMMISVGYYFDQVSRERMVQRISQQVELIAASTPVEAPVGRTDVLWIETAHPVYHELTTTWQIDGQAVSTAKNARYLDLGTVRPAANARTVSVTVVDPTTFVRDPEIRKTALTATRSWALSAGATTPQAAAVPVFTGSTLTTRPVGGRDVVYVATSAMPEVIPTVTWRLNGAPVPTASGDGRVFPLAEQDLPPGRHQLTAHVATRTSPIRGISDPETSRTWTIDNTEPTVAATLSPAVSSFTGADGTTHYFMRDEFTMKLDPTDDQPGYVVAEFRVNNDGWHHYYGWPDAPPGTPYRFTPRGTTIKELVYGSLSSEGLSPQPWEPREPGWGTHRIEYRGIDAAGNVGTAKAYRVTILPSPVCSTTISAPHKGPLRVATGVTCVEATTVDGEVSVAPGASLIAREARFGGRIIAEKAAAIEIVGGSVRGPLRVDGATERVTLFGATLADVTIAGVKTAKPVLIHGNTINGGLACQGNAVPPDIQASPNVIARGGHYQCAPR